MPRAALSAAPLAEVLVHAHVLLGVVCEEEEEDVAAVEDVAAEAGAIPGLLLPGLLLAAPPGAIRRPIDGDAEVPTASGRRELWKLAGSEVESGLGCGGACMKSAKRQEELEVETTRPETGLHGVDSR